MKITVRELKKLVRETLQLEYDYDQSQELHKNSERAKQGRKGYEGHPDYAKRCPNCDGMNFHQYGNQRVCADCDYTIEESKNEFGGQSGNPFASSGRARARELTQHGPSPEVRVASYCICGHQHDRELPCDDGDCDCQKFDPQYHADEDFDEKKRGSFQGYLPRPERTKRVRHQETKSLKQLLGLNEKLGEHEGYAICPECGSDNAALWYEDPESPRGRCDDCGAKWNETERKDGEFNKWSSEESKRAADEDDAEQRAAKKYTGEWADVP